MLCHRQNIKGLKYIVTIQKYQRELSHCLDMSTYTLGPKRFLIFANVQSWPEYHGSIMENLWPSVQTELKCQINSMDVMGETLSYCVEKHMVKHMGNGGVLPEMRLDKQLEPMTLIYSLQLSERAN